MERKFSDLTDIQALRLVGKIYYFEPILYSQVEDLLVKYPSIITMLEQVKDKNVKAYLQKERRNIEDELLRKGIKANYPDYPDMEIPEEELWT